LSFNLFFHYILFSKLFTMLVSLFRMGAFPFLFFPPPPHFLFFGRYTLWAYGLHKFSLFLSVVLFAMVIPSVFPSSLSYLSRLSISGDMLSITRTPYSCHLIMPFLLSSSTSPSPLGISFICVSSLLFPIFVTLHRHSF
jgi:hypothetical protein